MRPPPLAIPDGIGPACAHAPSPTPSLHAGSTTFVDVDGADPRLVVLKTQQERFAVQGFGQAIVVPWDPSVAAVLNECVS